MDKSVSVFLKRKYYSFLQGSIFKIGQQHEAKNQQENDALRGKQIKLIWQSAFPVKATFEKSSN